MYVISEVFATAADLPLSIGDRRSACGRAEGEPAYSTAFAVEHVCAHSRTCETITPEPWSPPGLRAKPNSRRAGLPDQAPGLEICTSKD